MRFAQLLLVGAASMFLTASSGLGPAHAAGPSFSCDKATAPVDRAICADPDLSALDLSLEQEFRAALAGDPAGRDDTLRAQRAWLKGRADACHLPRQGQATKEQTVCLADLTKDRLAILQPRDPRDVILATRIADLIRRKNGFINDSDSLAAELGKDPDSPVRFTTEGEPLTNKIATRLPSFDELEDMKREGAVYRFGDLLAVGAVEGTAHCWYYTVFHEVGAKYESVATPAPANGHCGETIDFGSTTAGDDERSLPLFADESYHIDKPTLLLLAFRGDRWRRVGRFALVFETALAVTDQSCAAQVPCAEMASDALQLARARDAAGAEEPNRLGAATRTTELPKDSPVDLPAFGGHSFNAYSVFEGGAPVYKLATARGVLAMRVSHGTLGWRVNEDYDVGVYEHRDDRWQPVAGFQIAKKRVKLRSVSVE